MPLSPRILTTAYWKLAAPLVVYKGVYGRMEESLSAPCNKDPTLKSGKFHHQFGGLDSVPETGAASEAFSPSIPSFHHEHQFAEFCDNKVLERSSWHYQHWVHACDQTATLGTCRMENTRLPKVAFYGEPCQGKRGRGATRESYKDQPRRLLRAAESQKKTGKTESGKGLVGGHWKSEAPPRPRILVPRVSKSMQFKDRPSKLPEGLPSGTTFPLILGLEEPATIVIYV